MCVRFCCGVPGVAGVLDCLLVEEEERYHGLCLVSFESSKLVWSAWSCGEKSEGRGWVKSGNFRRRRSSWFCEVSGSE